jgi:glycosyltransferase involved in cell wall biosynthesis
MENKVLVSISTYNAPAFLSHLLQSIDRYDAGYDYDLLIVDNTSDNTQQLKILERYASKYRIEQRPNEGRAQGGYNYAWQNNKNYKYYFFLHDDSAIIRDNWLKLAVDRIEDNSLESALTPDLYDWPETIGKVGFQTYEWGNKYKYLRTGFPQIFRYMDPVADLLQVKIPEYYQHINDDKYLIRNELLQKMGKIWNVGDFHEMEKADDPMFHSVSEWYEERFPNTVPLKPYDGRYNAFQTCSEFFSDIAPMRYGYRTHCVLGDGHCQEQLGWSKFWGNTYIVHYGDHVIFKRLALILKTTEEEVRKNFKNEPFLNICDNIIKKDTLP